MSLINVSLIADYPLTISNRLNKRPTFFVNSIQGVSLESIVKDKCCKSFVFGRNHIKSYDVKTYRKLAFVAVAMTLEKYDVKTLYKEHIIFTAIATMMYFFRVFDDEGNYIVNVNDITVVLSELLDTDLTTFEQVAKFYNFHVDKEEKRTRANKKNIPTCVQDLTECFEVGMTQTEKKEAIMKWWHCGERTARKYMQQYGLTEKKYERSDYKELHEHIDEATDEICNHIDERTDKLQQSIGAVDDKLTMLNDNLVSLFTANFSLPQPR